MTSMHVVIGSLRAPKIEGVRRACMRAANAFGIPPAALTFESRAVPSGVASTPRSMEATLEGARNRALAIFPGDRPGALSVGVEGGLFEAGGTVFLQSWACVYNGREFGFGGSGAIALPPALRHAVMVEQRELGDAIDVIAGEHDVRSRQGTWGVLTKDAVSREDSFDQAVFHALMPLLNRSIYPASDPSLSPHS